MTWNQKRLIVRPMFSHIPLLFRLTSNQSSLCTQSWDSLEEEAVCSQCSVCGEPACTCVYIQGVQCIYSPSIMSVHTYICIHVGDNYLVNVREGDVRFRAQRPNFPEQNTKAPYVTS